MATKKGSAALRKNQFKKSTKASSSKPSATRRSMPTKLAKKLGRSPKKR